MKRATLASTLITGLLLISPSISKAQYFWDYGIRGGASNYLGDLGGNELTRRDFVSDMKLSQTHFTAGGFVRYKINPMFSVMTDMNYVRISGDDKLSSNPGRNGRNLNFRNDIYEATAQLQFFFYEVHDLGHTYRYANSFRAFIGLGLGAAYHNPKASYNGTYVPLRALTTEGNKYTKVTAVIPATAGFYFTFKKKYRIGWNINWRTTFSDYLDDVSTQYADPSTLPSALSVDLANRTDELNVSNAFAENFTAGNKRGDPTHKDSYVTTSIDMGYVIRGHSSAGRPHGIYDWIGDRQNHPDKYGSSTHHPHSLLIRKRRYHW